MAVFIDSEGRYYQSDKAKSETDARIEHPTLDMLAYLTETPLPMPEFGKNIIEGKIAAHNESLKPQAPVEQKEPDPKVNETDLTNL